MDATIVIGKDGVLLPCEVLIHFKQEVNGGRAEDVGMVSVNLAEFASSRSTTKRYLLQESRLNSVVRVTMNMKLVKGDPVSYKVPTGKKDITTSLFDQATDADGRPTGITALVANTEEHAGS
ncbi:hypothetical protein HK102_006229, partial [Quaeritorhiza haematococci]